MSLTSLSKESETCWSFRMLRVEIKFSLHLYHRILFFQWIKTLHHALKGYCWSDTDPWGKKKSFAWSVSSAGAQIRATPWAALGVLASSMAQQPALVDWPQDRFCSTPEAVSPSWAAPDSVSPSLISSFHFHLDCHSSFFPGSLHSPRLHFSSPKGPTLRSFQPLFIFCWHYLHEISLKCKSSPGITCVINTLKINWVLLEGYGLSQYSYQ